jgi:hypothetical protein
MAKSKATTVEEYLEELPEERRAIIAAVREVILKNLPKGYHEAMNWGVISYEVPLESYPTTYNGKPLMYAGLSAQKNYCVVYLMTAYGDSEHERWFREAFRKAGKKLDMGKCCVRFRKLDELPLNVIGQMIARTPPKKWIALFEASRKR